MRHFLKETDMEPQELNDLFEFANDLKQHRKEHPTRPLERQSWGLLFYKNSTRTRVSFQVGIHELGGQCITLTADNTQITRGESVRDTAKVLGRYLHGLVIRSYEHEVIEMFAQESDVPIINALTDYLHPCQIYSDLFTLAERWCPGKPSLEAFKGKKLAFLGDTSCNMANSWILGGALTDMTIAMAGPADYPPAEPIRDELEKAGLKENFYYTEDPVEAIRDADVVYTDVWVSMGRETEEIERIPKMKPYAVTMELMKQANPEALFMHCLPAHPELEVSQQVLDSPHSIVFDQAENRLHMQKAILSKLIEEETR